MATGRLATPIDMPSGSNQTAYTCPASTFAVATVSICNRNGSSVSVRLALGTSGSPLDSEYLEYDTVILGNGVLERTGIVLKADETIIVRSNNTGVSVVVYGIETATA
jgi:hypothetical protein